MKRLLIVATLSLGLLFGLNAFASGNAEHGKELTKKCSCHKNKLILDGRSEGELLKAMTDYKAGQGKSKPMINLMQKYSDQDIADLAAWYASQPAPK